MSTRRWNFVLMAASLVFSACATPPAPGSRDEAIDLAWERFCKSGFCEGYPARIIGKTDTVLEVSINGNKRYLVYTVSGSAGNYTAQVRPTANNGRAAEQQSPPGTEFPAGAKKVEPEELKRRVADKFFAYKVTGGGVQFKGEHWSARSAQGFTAGGKYTIDGSSLCYGTTHGCSEVRAVGDVLFLRRVSDGLVVELEEK